ncbi:putative quinol monooxygenase [Devosia ginsengisoli]|uniref:Antibiotic biosynthesis monooxygenase n=1 Tax=Devosia ginsengisoli TaxID=400770 RepID=A0A5B8LUN0_9HYPH|nr:antibiotic biosynthesis monooxygenase family protein [Devosia ginsengisoli]QDZ11172.1 antibiotic biosynthesis monooxygenase [Devosia ginsengisoli]
MIIIAGYSRYKDGIERDAAVAAFADMVGRARQADGCVDMAISADALDPERSNLFECWRDKAAWDAWRKVAKAPRLKVRATENQVNLYQSDKAERL